MLRAVTVSHFGRLHHMIQGKTLGFKRQIPNIDIDSPFSTTYSQVFHLFLHISVVVVVVQGPEPMPRLHCSLLGLLYDPVAPCFRHSHCRRQMPPRPMRHERSQQRKVELYGQ
jgi:hypothetical protein